MVIITTDLDEEWTDKVLLKGIRKVEKLQPKDILHVIMILCDVLAPNKLTFEILIVTEKGKTMEMFKLPLDINGYATSVSIRTYGNVVMFETDTKKRK